MDPGYYENERSELLALVEPASKRILDVGCAKGRFGASLKRLDPARTVVGIESNPTIAEEASYVLDQVVVGDIENLTPGFEKDSFDHIVFADVLEHLRDPWNILALYYRFLKQGGSILCSIPNIRHYTAFLKLLKMGWEYEEFGLFDKTHLRFFSLRSMRELIESAGFTIVEVIPKVVASKKMRMLNAIMLGTMNDFLAIQYLIKARKQ